MTPEISPLGAFCDTGAGGAAAAAGIWDSRSWIYEISLVAFVWNIGKQDSIDLHFFPTNPF